MTFHSRARAPALTAALIATALGVSLSGCAHKDKGKTDLSYQERPVELIYATGAQKLDERQWSEAAQYFDEVERQHPYSEWARRSILMEAYAYYESNKYDDAISAADRFVSLYPGNPSAPYAYYLKAVCYWEQIADVTRDQGDTQQALAAFREIEKRYPASEYAVRACRSPRSAVSKRSWTSIRPPAMRRKPCIGWSKPICRWACGTRRCATARCSVTTIRATIGTNRRMRC